MSSAAADVNATEQSPLREELVSAFFKAQSPLFPNSCWFFKIQTAVKFLQNQNVISTPLAQKQQFLQRKGLSDREIQVACERSGAYDVYEKQRVPVVPVRTATGPVNYGQIQQYNWLERLKEIVHNTALISAVVYAIYMFYQVSNFCSVK